MKYKVAVVIEDPKTEKGFTSCLFFELDFTFYCDEDDYGNGHYLSIRGKDFSEKYIDLRYDKTFKRAEKEQYILQWCKNYWCGERGAWKLKKITIVIE